MLGGFFQNMGQNIKGKFQDMGQNIKNNAFGGAFGNKHDAAIQEANPFGASTGEQEIDSEGNPIFMDKEGNQIDTKTMASYKDQGWKQNEEGEWENPDMKKKMRSDAFSKNLGNSLLDAASNYSQPVNSPTKKQQMGGIQF